MQTHLSTTPFGRRRVTLGQISSQAAARELPGGSAVPKWQVFQHIREARDLIGATDRALAILNALLSFHLETVLTAETGLVVWPSNEQLSARANGMPAATLRRHLAVLVDCGLIIRRDSPNGKRFARKGRGGEIEQAYGFDLSPLVARAAEFKSMAEVVQAEKQALRVSRERLTLLRRDIVKMIDTGLKEEVPGAWGKMQIIYRDILAKLPRSAPRQLIDAVCDELHLLWQEIRDLLESFVNSQNQSANESQFERHIQNSNPDSHFDSKNRLRNEEEAYSSGAKTDNVKNLPKRELPLGIVLDACPGMAAIAGGATIRHWRELAAAAELARPMLGVSPSAWADACEAMGERQAVITLAAIYQRSDQIGNAGGYLRSLTERARKGKFSTWPMIMALLRAKLDAGKGSDATRQSGARADRDGSDLPVSEALLKNLRQPKPRQS
jgi:replication initiation protein RepC